MNWHIFERVATKIGLTGTVATLGYVNGIEKWLDFAAKVPQQWWVVIWMACITVFMMQWAIRVGIRTPRSPNGETSRLRERLDKLDERVDKACERLARIEGNLGSLVEVDGGKSG